MDRHKYTCNLIHSWCILYAPKLGIVPVRKILKACVWERVAGCEVLTTPFLLREYLLRRITLHYESSMENLWLQTTFPQCSRESVSFQKYWLEYRCVWKNIKENPSSRKVSYSNSPCHTNTWILALTSTNLRMPLQQSPLWSRRCQWLARSPENWLKMVVFLG